MRRAFGAVLFLSLLCSAVPVRAQSGESSEYKEAVSLGLTEFEEKNFLEARVQFARAHSLDPSARTLRALGMVHFELKEYALSARYLSEALASNDRPLDADKREKALKLLERAQRYVGRIALDVDPTAQLTVDGTVIPRTANDQLTLDVGEHSLEFKAEGYLGERRTIKVRGGETLAMRIRLIEVSAATSRAPGDDRQSERRPVYKNPWLWAIVGIVVAGAAAGTAVALTRKTEKRSAEPNPGGDDLPIVVGLPR